MVGWLGVEGTRVRRDGLDLYSIPAAQVQHLQIEELKPRLNISSFFLIKKINNKVKKSEQFCPLFVEIPKKKIIFVYIQQNFVK